MLAPHLDEEGILKQGAPSNAVDLQQEVESLQSKVDIVSSLIRKAKDHIDSSER